MFDQLAHDYLSVVWKRETEAKETKMKSSVEDAGKSVRGWWWRRRRTRKVKGEMKRPPTGGNKKGEWEKVESR